MLTDCHVHVSLFPGPREICEQAALHETSLIGVSCSYEDSVRNLEFASIEGYDAMIGIHPWMATQREFPAERFEKLIYYGNVRGLGECGLDGERSPLNLQDQTHLLAGALEFADRFALPLNLHVHRAHAEMIKLLREYKERGLCGCVHNFTFSKELARDYINCNMFLSIGRPLLKRPRRLVESMLYAGPHRILLESDYDHLKGPFYDGELIVKLAGVYAQIFAITFDEACALLEVNVRNYLDGTLP